MSTVHISMEIFCSLQVEGIHFWKDCPYDEVEYLRDPHRHVFHIKAYQNVDHSDRDIEFIKLKHNILEYLNNKYYDDKLKMLFFGPMSCEMIALELIDRFDLTRCEVSEDGENGSDVRILSTIAS